MLRYLLLSYLGTSALPGQESHRSDPKHIATQWTSLLPLSVRKQGDQEVDPRTPPQGAHLSQLIALWETNRAGAEERQALMTLH
jgi:hypothetical protein